MRGGVVVEVGLLVPGIRYRVLWVTDGVVKIAAGSSMVWLSYRV
ncbi:hypothetical protein EV652_101846 [Kribbella steppae]|uniref:Uncharacterized protein n=1 Tax=Kribbella steppae TaxID=2512223 RepID=A0A4R2HZ76_9ACTN|nr:hypothetical protein [Kribbella steppae]TCO35958.1 hypothetical protein EV652_101846 [Kribbella steppae]